MGLREQLAERRRRWEEFHCWERDNPPPRRPPADLLADVGTLWNWLPDEIRRSDPDPEKLHIRNMRANLTKLSDSR